MKVMLGVIALFSITVIGALYFLFGGPIPQSITWEGEPGTPFEGRYLVTTEPLVYSRGNPLERLGEGVTSRYPHTVYFWAPRSATVLASAQLYTEGNVQNSLQIRRLAVPCVEAYRWGTSITAECED